MEFCREGDEYVVWKLDASTDWCSTIFGAAAKFERALILERTVAGLEAALACERKGGRRPIMDGSGLQAHARQGDADPASV